MAPKKPNPDPRPSLDTPGLPHVKGGQTPVNKVRPNEPPPPPITPKKK